MTRAALGGRAASFRRYRIERGRCAARQIIRVTGTVDRAANHRPWPSDRARGGHAVPDERFCAENLGYGQAVLPAGTAENFPAALKSPRSPASELPPDDDGLTKSQY